MASSRVSLNDEVFHLIFKHLSSICPKTLRAVCLVSRRFYRLAISSSSRSFTVTPSKQRNLEKSSLVHIKAHVLLYTRDIVIEDTRLDWQLLAELISKLGQLDSIRWNFDGEEPIPTIIYDSLMKIWPSIAFHVEDLPILNIQWRVRKTISQLSHFENLRSIKASINTTFPPVSQLLDRLLATCANLQVLHVKPEESLGIVQGECGRGRTSTSTSSRYVSVNIFENSPAGMDFSIKEGEGVILLREFVYETNKSGLPSIQTSSWDWTQLRHLEVRGPTMPEFLKSIEGRVPSLQVLILKAIECPTGDDWTPHRDQEGTNHAMNEFLSSVRGLKILDVINCQFELQFSNVFAQGHTLKHFSYNTPRRCREPGSYLPQPSVSVQDLKTLRASCPNLKSMAIHVDILNDYLPYDILSTLTQFPHLDALRLYLSFTTAYHDPTRRAHLATDILTIQHLIGHLKTHKIGTTFRIISIVIGHKPRNFSHTPRASCDPGCCDGIDRYDRPEITFRYHRDQGGVVENDSKEIRHVAWDEYLDRDGESEVLGQTYPANLEG